MTVDDLERSVGDAGVAVLEWLGRNVVLLAVLVLVVAVLVLDDGPPPAEVRVEVPSTTSTTPVPWCDPATGDRVVPGAGIQEGHPECPQPPLRHAPPGTGPNTGPAGEPSS